MAQDKGRPRGRLDDIADLLSGRVYNTLRLLLKRTARLGPLERRLRRVMQKQKELEEQLNTNLGRISRAIGSVGERLRNQEGRLREMQGRIDAGEEFSSADLAGEVEQTAALAEQLENLARVADPADPTTITADGVLATDGSQKAGVVLSEEPGQGGGKVAPGIGEALDGGRDTLTGMPSAGQAVEAARDATLTEAGGPAAGSGQTSAAVDAGESAPGAAGSAPGAAGGDPAAD
jgi:hypothetical protein